MLVCETEIGVDGGGEWVETSRILEQSLSISILLLLHGDIAKSPQNLIVLTIVNTEPSLIIVLCSLGVFDLNELMPTQCESKRVTRIDLDRSLKELNCGIMLILSRVAVANDDPRLGRKQILSKDLIGELAKINHLLQSPKTN